VISKVLKKICCTAD